MSKTKGSQIRDNSITAQQISTTYTGALLKADGSTPLSGNISAAGFRITGLPQPSASDEPARLADLQLQSFKTVCKLATTANIALTGVGQSIDGVAVAAADRILVWKQTSGAENGIYIAASGAWQRAADANGVNIRGARVPVEQGTLWGDHQFVLITDFPITVGTTSLSFVDLGPAAAAAYPRVQAGLVCNSVSTNYGLATATTIAATPTSGGAVAVRINSVDVYTTSDRTGEGYWSRDSGTSAVALNGIQSGDSFYFNAIIAGYPIDSTDTISFSYSA